MKIVIVGLGLMGGSMAMALKGFHGAERYGIDHNPAVIEKALKHGVIDQEGFPGDTDLVIIALPPKAAVAFLQNEKMPPKALITDVCGIKEALMEAAMARNIRYIGGHPMAGKEKGGFDNRDLNLFRHKHYILVPPKNALKEDIALLKEMTRYIGCADTVMTDAQTHDERIAFTSQLMHILALSLCLDPAFLSVKGFEGNSFAGATRVADMDTSLWLDLFFENKVHLKDCIARLRQNLQRFETALGEGDKEKLLQLLNQGAAQKRTFNEGYKWDDI